MKLTRPVAVKPAFKTAPVKEAPKKNPNDDMDLQDIVRILTDVTKQNKDFAEGLNVLTTKVDTIVKSIADVMKANQEFCANVVQEISAISEYINIQPDEQAKELADQTEEEDTENEVDTIEDAEAAEEGVTVEDIMSMKKGELLALIEDNDVPLDVSKYAKLGDLRKALIQYLQDQYDADNEDDNGGEDDGVSDDTSTGADADAGEGSTDTEEDDESDADGAEGDASNDASSDDDEEDDW